VAAAPEEVAQQEEEEEEEEEEEQDKIMDKMMQVLYLSQRNVLRRIRAHGGYPLSVLHESAAHMPTKQSIKLSTSCTKLAVRRGLRPLVQTI
jgi:hypothetical protein